MSFDSVTSTTSPKGILKKDIGLPFESYFYNLKKAPHDESVQLDNNWIHITFLLDRSESMGYYGIHFNYKHINNCILKFIKDNKEKNISITILGFDNKINIIYDKFYKKDGFLKNPYEIFIISERDIYPRASTALTESVAFAIKYTGNKMSHWGTTIGKTRPYKVVLATITDGYENSSSGEWAEKKGKVKLTKIVEEHKNIWNWKFFLLGTTIDSRKAGTSMGYDESQCIDFIPRAESFEKTMNSCSSALLENRGFSQEERQESMCYNDIEDDENINFMESQCN